MTKQTTPTGQKERIRLQNDLLRQGGFGGRIIITAGVEALGSAFVSRAITAVATFDAFDEDNDPHQEHDFGALTVDGERLFFKIDYYDLACAARSPDPADPVVTCRIMTVMLASEY